MSDLTDAFRAKYPDAYKDMSDDDLEKAIITKYPEYKNHPTASANSETTAEPEKESLLSSIWHKATAPLTDYLPDLDNPRKIINNFAETFQHPNANDSGLTARLKGFAGGAMSGLEDTVAGLTSPLNIILAGASGGASVAERSGYEGAAQGLRRVAQAASVPIVSQGIHDTITKPTIGGKLAGGLNAILGAAGVAGGSLGEIGEAARDASPEIKSNPLANIPVSKESLPVNELPPDLVPVGQESAFNASRPTEPPVKPAEESLFELAKAKQNMGQDLPAEERIPETTAVTRIVDKGKPFHSEFDSSKFGAKDGTFVIKGHLSDEQAAQVNDMYKSGNGDVLRGHVDKPVDFNGTDEFGNEIGQVSKDAKFTPVEEPKSQSIDDIFNKPQSQKSLFSFGSQNKQADNIFPLENGNPEITADRAANPDKPRYRLDNASGGLVPIDAKGEVIGSTIYPKSSLGDGTIPPEEPPTQGTMGFGKDSQPKPDKSSLLQKIYDTPRGMMSVDLPYMTSAAFRQASPYVGTADWFKAWIPAAKSFGSKEAYEAINSEIANRPLFRPGHNMPSQAETAGLQLTDLGKYSRREESLRGELAEKVPVYGKYVAASNRAYTAFLNSLRANRFEDLVGNLQKDGIDNPQNRNQIANAINTLTGRGKLAAHPNVENGGFTNIEGAAKVLSNVFFSPRKIASEVQMLNPATYIMTNPVARKELLAGALRRVGIWWGLAGMAELSGATVSKDPTNPDFGKIKIGDTRIDPPGGLQQYLVLGTQLAKGGKTSSTSGKFTAFGSKVTADTAFDNISNFVTNRFHPTAKYIVDLAKAGKSRPFYAGDSALQLATPMYTQDLAQIARENPKLVPMLLGAPLSGAGIGVQSYDKNSFKNPTFLPHQYDLKIPAGR